MGKLKVFGGKFRLQGTMRNVLVKARNKTEARKLLMEAAGTTEMVSEYYFNKMWWNSDGSPAAKATDSEAGVYATDSEQANDSMYRRVR